MKFRQALILFCYLIATEAVGQSKVMVFDSFFNISTDQLGRDTAGMNAISFQPVLIERHKSINDSTVSRSWVRRKLFREHFLVLRQNEVYITADPAFNIEAGRDIADKATGNDERNLYKNTRGFNVEGNITKQVGFRTSFYENQAVLPDYLHEYVVISQVVPGQGRVKPFKKVISQVVPGQGRVKPFKNGFDYSQSTASIFYTPAEQICIRFGHDKHFLGEGYRSLMLSDNGFSYPFFRTDLFLFERKLVYSFMFTSFQSLTRIKDVPDTEPPFLRMSGNFHYLSWTMAKWLRMGAMEGTVFQSMDSSGKTTFEAYSINPVIGVNSFSNGLKRRHKSLVGLDMKILISDAWFVYFQSVWDKNRFDRPALQFSLNRRGKVNRLRLEYNQVSGGVYEGSGDEVAFMHYNQSLAHPAGNNFKELLGMALLRHRRWFTTLKLNYIGYEDAYLSPLIVNNASYQPGVNVTIQEMALGWTVNPANGMNLKIGLIARNNDLAWLNNTTYIYFGFSTSLPSAYYDF